MGRGAPAMALRILVVDDNRDSADSLAMLFQLQGHDARVAYHGAEVPDIARWFVPDLAMIDLAMPDVDGFQVLHALRALPQLSHTVLVAMTGFGQQSDRDRTQEAGFDMHLVKPVELSLLEALLVHVERQRREREGDAGDDRN
jgi:CheY-like chemotaxis protein